MGDTRRRVKLYVLSNNTTWDDHGTGHVSVSEESEYLPRWTLTVRSEEDGSTLLETCIRPDISYQMQHDALIVWTEMDEHLALSFQEKKGREEIMEMISEGQRQTAMSLGDLPDDNDSNGVFQGIGDVLLPDLPPCELSKLEDISETLSSVLATPAQQQTRKMMAEKLAQTFEETNYIKQLIELFHVCEDLENTEGLHHLYEIIQSLFLLNHTSIVEVLLSDDYLLDVVGCLEHDPRQQQPSQHRQFLTSQAQLKEVIPLNDPDLKSKMQLTYRAQYIQDVLMPMPLVFEENMLSALHSIIMFNKGEIVMALQMDDAFLTTLFQTLLDESVPMARAVELLQFLKEFDQFSASLKSDSRLDFYRALINHGFFTVLSTYLAMDEEDIQSAVVPILCHVCEFSPLLIREMFLEGANANEDEDQLLLNVVIGRLVDDGDGAVGGCMAGVLRLVLGLPPMAQQPKGKISLPPVFSDFLAMFYRLCMPRLTAPLLSLASGGNLSRDDDWSAGLCRHILEVLCICVGSHCFHMRNYVTSRDLLRRILVLVKSSHSHLALSALRLLRQLIGLKDAQVNNHIIRNDHLRPVVELLLENKDEYNLTNSACIELFEFIRSENIRELVAYVMTTYIEELEKISYVGTFEGLRRRHEIEKMRIQTSPECPEEGGTTVATAGRFRRDARSLDDDEEVWFNEEEADENGPLFEEEENLDDVPLPAVESSNIMGSLLNRTWKPMKLKRPSSDEEDDDEMVGSVFKAKESGKASGSFPSLVDYDDEEEEEEESRSTDNGGDDEDVDESRRTESLSLSGSPAKRRKV